ncbi:hypothetical protein SLA2020_123940 [Shorea laevis]
MESKYSSLENGEENHGMFNAEICGEEYGSNEGEQLQGDEDFNLNEENMLALAGDEEVGLYSNGLILSKDNGLEENSEPAVGLCQDKEQDKSEIRPESVNSEMAEAKMKLGIRDLKEKRQKEIWQCYPVEMADQWEEGQPWVTTQMKDRKQRRQHEKQIAEHKAKWVRSDSLSNGCIAHRNRVIQRELNANEVRQMMNIGRRLGIQLQENEGEVQSRLMELEMHVDKRGRQ